jgi:hypothetical protein
MSVGRAIPAQGKRNGENRSIIKDYSWMTNDKTKANIKQFPLFVSFLNR